MTKFQWRAQGVVLILCFLAVAAFGHHLAEIILVYIGFGLGTYTGFILWRHWE